MLLWGCTEESSTSVQLWFRTDYLHQPSMITGISQGLLHAWTFKRAKRLQSPHYLEAQ